MHPSSPEEPEAPAGASADAAPFGDLSATLSALGRRGLYRRRRVVEGPPGREVRVDGRTLLNFSGNDYLGLAADPRVRAAFRSAAETWGVGAGASHLVCGHTRVHHELEEALADFTRRPRALVFATGYGANVGTLGALLGPRDHVWQDRLNHASLIDGGRLSGAAFHWYEHRDAAGLAAALASAPDTGRRLVVTDGTFSMDGDLCPLDDLVSACRAHRAWLLVDDAHGFGVHGAGGRGVVDPARHGTEDVPVLVGTLGKAFGTAGAFVTGSEVLVETLVQRCRTYVYSTALPPAVAAATLTSLRIVQEEPERRLRLVELVEHFRAGATGLGLKLLPSTTPIQPVIVGEAGPTVALSRALERLGCLVVPIRPPTVPPGTARLRITFSALHRRDDVDRLLAALATASAELAR